MVVNCAGRTRSIMGAQSLINAGIPNRVVALRNGTMGWHLAGLALDHGQSRYLPEVSPGAGRGGAPAGRAVGARFGVRRIDRATLEAWQADPARTTYLLDVRSPRSSWRATCRARSRRRAASWSRPPTATSAPCGARIVLVDDDGVRATMTASWLNQMGLHEVAVLEGGCRPARGGSLEVGPRPERALGLSALRYREIAPDALRVALRPAARSSWT